MKKLCFCILCSLVLLTIPVIAVSHGNIDSSATNANDRLVMEIGDTAILDLSESTLTGFPSWVGDPSVISFIGNPYGQTITAIGPGTTTIGASYQYSVYNPVLKAYQYFSKEDQWYISVNGVDPTSITLPASTLTMYADTTTTLSPTVSPSSGWTDHTWSSSNTAVATVSTAGKVTPVSIGTVTITCTTRNNLKASCTITILPPIWDEPTYDPDDGATAIAIDQTFTATMSYNLHQGRNFSNITMCQTSTNQAVAVETALSGSKLSVTPKTWLNEGETYTITVPAGAVKNQWGGETIRSYSWTVTTEAFQIVSTFPMEGEVAAPVNDSIVITTSQSLAKGIAFRNITLTNTETNRTVSISADIEDNQLVITPNQALDDLTAYQLTIPANGLNSATGIAYSTAFTLDFTTTYSIGSGTGTADDPYLISSMDQLSYIRYDLDAAYRLTKDIWFYGDVLDCIVGTFTGQLDGDGYTLYQAVFQGDDNDTVFGLFQRTQGATIENLTIETSETATYYNQYIGLFVGVAYDTTFQNCHANGEWTITTEKADSVVGGMVGLLNGGSIENCSGGIYLEIQLNSDGDVNYCGGLIGATDLDLEASEQFQTTSLLQSCRFHGDLNVSLEDAVKNIYVGGIAGWVTSAQNCSVDADITVYEYSASVYSHVGGGFGWSAGAISCCSYQGDIRGTHDSTNNNYWSIYRHYGGLIGHAKGTVTKSFAMGTLYRNMSHRKNNVPIVYTRSGGLIGAAVGATISQCYADVDITDTGTVETSSSSYRFCSHFYSGGLIGYFSESSAENCYALGSVSCTVSLISTTVKQEVATNNFIGFYDDEDTHVKNCFATGAVSQSGYYITSKGKGFATTSSNSTIVNCYYNEDILTRGEASSTMGLTTAELQDSTNFKNWDFDTIWQMGESHPVFRTDTRGTLSAEGNVVTATLENNWYGCQLLVAAYSEGRFVDMELVSIAGGVDQWCQSVASLSQNGLYSVNAFLLDGTFVPLCPAAS